MGRDHKGDATHSYLLVLGDFMGLFEYLTHPLSYAIGLGLVERMNVID